MFNFLTRLFSHDNNSEPSEKESYIRFSLEGKVNEKLFPKLISGILGLTFTGGVIYGVSTIVVPSEAEVTPNPTQIKSVTQPPNQL